MIEFVLGCVVESSSYIASIIDTGYSVDLIGGHVPLFMNGFMHCCLFFIFSISV